MKFGVYVIFDTLSYRYLHLFVEDNDATAQRAFYAWCNNVPQPADYKLYRAGDWNTNSGEIEGFAPEFVCDGWTE